MKNMLPEWKDRLNYWIETLKQDLYLPLQSIALEGFFTMDQLSPRDAEQQTFQPLLPGQPWGEPWQYCWMRGEITIPPEAAGKRVVMDLQTGGESTIFVDGISFGTRRAEWVTVPHHYIEDNVLSLSAMPGRKYHLLIEAYAGHAFPESKKGGCSTGPVLPGQYAELNHPGPRTALGTVTFGIWNEDAYQLYMDLETLRSLGDQLDPESLRADRVAQALEQATLTVDFEQSLSDRIRDYQAARAVLRPVMEAVNGTSAPVFYAVGNAHLDLAWLWPMQETVRKTSRTFAQQLRLLEQYPAYRYIQSQPAAYEMCRASYPELFQRILQAAREGRWIPEGAMWVEPDTNMTSGESLIRQVLHGKRYFREVFGVDSVVLWLPDSFGYSAALPQILKGTGVKYLVTQKIFWSYNEGERFPYHYFTWQGADGTEIDTFLPTSYTYDTTPRELCETWKGRVQKRGLDAFLFPFGYGDGGGGPSRDHIEYLLREEDLEGMPRVKMAGPVEFFEDMEKQGGPGNRYVGELYFTAHRGVYTSQADIKKGNRKSELALREAELWGALAGMSGFVYPRGRMDAAWKLLLLNQFHDILPGSSIGPVYEKARADHRLIIEEAESVKKDALTTLTRGEGFSVFNSLSFPRKGLIPLPDRFAYGAVTDNGEPVPVQRTADGVLGRVSVPSCGAVSLKPVRIEDEVTETASARMTESGAVLANRFVHIELNQRGEVVSFVDRETGREFAAGPMNRLLAYKDVPRVFDAWDIDSNYIDQPVELDEPVTLTVREEAGLRAVLHISRKVMHSSWEQDVVLSGHGRRLDFITQAEWRELHRLLKVDFPINVQAAEGINEIQFGYIARPTHRSRLFDKDRFEVCNHRYSALCDQSHGAAVLNDCKYGISMNGSALQLSLLRAAACPEMRADNGKHEFRYAFLGWEGPFLESPVVREACDLNVPLQTAEGGCESFSAFQVNRANILIDTVKPAEDGSGDLILRMYEAKQADTTCELIIHLPLQRVMLCDMLENAADQLLPDKGCITLHFHPFEVKTLRLIRKA